MIALNQYFQHKMFRSMGWSLTNAWIPTTINFVVITLLVILFVGILILLWNTYLSRVISVRDKPALIRIFAYALAAFGFLASFYVANKYWLPYRFATVSLLADLGLLCFWFSLPWLLFKVPWTRLLLPPRIASKLALLFMILQALLASVLYLDAKTNTPPTVNVVWILLDALRPDHLGSYGYPKNTSPFIDDFAKKSILFRRAYSHESYTMASVSSFFTSTYPFVHRVLYDNPSIDVLSFSFLTIAEILKDKNYRTAAFVFNPHLKKGYNLGQGFDLYDDHEEGFDLDQSYPETYETARKIHEKLEKYLKEVHSRPLFLYLHYRDIHEPYAPPPPFDKGCVPADSPEVIDAIERRVIFLKGEEDVYRCLYDGDIRYTDHYLRQTFQLLHKNGITRDNTIWIITADHGQEFYEPHPGDDGYQSHGRTLYQEQIHVPLIVSVPKVQNRIIEQQVGLIDIAPTLLDLLGINWKKYHQFQGRSLKTLLKTGSGQPSLILAGGNRKRGVLIHNGWKYYLYEKSCKSNRKNCFVRPTKRDFLYGQELYNIDSDPNETKDLLSAHAQLAAQMQKQLTGFLNSVSFEDTGLRENLDEQTKEELKALGYIN